MRKYPYTILFLALTALGAAGAQPVFDGLKKTRFAARANFSRNGYAVHFPIFNDVGKKLIEISCYSLDDEERERFASRTKTDPVADLSCYVKDISRADEFTMLGLDGESLQFTPGFFWLSDVQKCAGKSYHMEAKLRGVRIFFVFSNVDDAEKQPDMNISVFPDPSATNARLTDGTARSYCQ